MEPSQGGQAVSDNYFPWPILILPLGLGFVIGMLLGTISTSSTWRASAVKTGHAQWVANYLINKLGISETRIQIVFGIKGDGSLVTLEGVFE
jgi:hypothetical protein